MVSQHVVGSLQVPSLDNFACMVKQLRDSSLGPDGMPYSAWAAIAGGIACLHRVLVAVAMGAQAPACELEYFRHIGRGCYKARLQDARSRRRAVLGVVWVDAEKADGANRSRLIAKELETYTSPELCAATSPIEPLKT